MEIVSCRGLKKVYGSGEGQVKALDGVDLSIAQGEFVAVVGLFCGLLAIIGIGNVFTNTFGFVRQRRREFARYLSIGMTPQGKKLFCIEALVLAGRPILVAVPVTAAATAFFLNMAYLDPMVFLRKTPWLPMLLFVLAVFGFVALAYSIGGKRVMESSLIDALRDDTLI